MRYVPTCAQPDRCHVCAEMQSCTDIVAAADKLAIQSLDPLWAAAAAALHTESPSLYFTRLWQQHQKRIACWMEYLCWHVTGHVKHQMMRKLFNIVFIYPSCVMMHLFSTRILALSLLMSSPLVSASVSNSFKDCSHFYTCRHHLQGWMEPACGGSARGTQTNCVMPLCMTAVAASPSTRPTSLRSLMGRGCIWCICHLMLSLRKADCFWAIMTLKL